MPKKRRVTYGAFITVGIILLSGGVCGFVSGCSQSPTEPTEKNFQTPSVTLQLVEVAHYWGWWYFAKEVQPTKGRAGDYGAPLNLAFIFNIHNPNAYPVRMEEIKFTVGFEEFDLNSVGTTDTQWIPPGKTNQVRISAMFDGRQSLMSLLVTGGFKLKEKGISAFDQLEKWWTTIPEFSFKIHVRDGSALFTAGHLTKVTSFNVVWPNS